MTGSVIHIGRHRSIARGAILLAAVACAAVTTDGAAQTAGRFPVDTLVTMQSGVITDRDLRERLELMPWPGKERPSVRDSIREKALSAMIAERLLAAAFERSGMQETGEIRRLRAGLENVLLRDLLYRQEVLSQVRITRTELQRGMERAAQERTVIVFPVRSRKEGEALARTLRASVRRDSTLMAHRLPGNRQPVRLVVSFGSAEPAVEDAAYSLKAGEVSQPVQTIRDGWVVIALTRIRQSDAFGNASGEERSRFVEKVVRGRDENELARSFYFDVLSRQTAQAEPGLFERLAEALEDLWRQDSVFYYQNGGFQFLPEVVDRLHDSLSNESEAPFIQLENGSIALGRILELLRYEQFEIPSLEPRSFRLELNERIKAMVANELLAEEARRRGLQYSDAFRREMRVWEGYWKSRLLYDTIRDTVRVGKGDMLRYLVDRPEVFGNRFEVNVREVLVPSRADAREVITEMATGRTLGELARERSMRTEWKERGGESGFFPVGQHPEIGFRAVLSDSGALVGPVDVPEGVSVFETIGARLVDGRPFSPDSFRVALHERLLAEKQRAVFSAYTRSLAEQENVAVNTDALSRVPVTTVNMFTRKYIGFGGIMSAVPILSSQWDWLVGLDKEIRLLP